MRRRFICFITLLNLLFFVYIIQGSEDHKSVTVLSWNVRNYNTIDRYIYGTFKRDYPKPEHEKNALRFVIQKTNPDIVFIQEIGGELYLNELKEDLKQHEGLIYPFDYCLSAEDEKRKLAVLSKIDLNVVKNGIGISDHFDYFGKKVNVKRGLLETHFELSGIPLILCSMHLKSRYTNEALDPCSRLRREKEARQIRDYLRQYDHSSQRFVLIGDLNDSANSQAYKRFTEVSEEPLFFELPVWDRGGQCWTYFHQKQRCYEQIDYVFMNEGFKNDNRFEIEASIVDFTEVLIASDHRPICLKIAVSD